MSYILEPFFSGIFLRPFLLFLEFVEENKVALKLNFTYWGTIPVSDFAFFIDFFHQIWKASEFPAKKKFFLV